MKKSYLLVLLITFSLESSLEHNPIFIKHAIEPAPKQTFLWRFHRFIRILITILTNQQIITQISTLKQLIVTIVQTALILIQNNQVNIHMNPDEIIRSIEQLDDDTKNQLSDIVVKKAHRFRIKKDIVLKKHDENTQIALAHFANIVANFFQIVQDPESKDVVVPNLVGMLASIVNIGAQVITQEQIPLNADNKTIEEIINKIDEKTIHELAQVIHRSVQRSGIEQIY